MNGLDALIKISQLKKQALDELMQSPNVILAPDHPYVPGQSFTLGNKIPSGAILVPMQLPGAQGPTSVAVWQQSFGDDKTLAENAEEAWKALQPKLGGKVYHKSVSDEHGTPQALYDLLDQEFDFTLDPCATDANHKCPVYYTKAENGLTQDWFGRVFMNPPFTKKQIKRWMHKLVYELVVGHIEVAVALVAARPDTEWWGLVSTYAREIRFLKGRLTFEGSIHPAPFPSAVCVFTPSTPAGTTYQHITHWNWQAGTYHAYWQMASARVQRQLEQGAISAWLRIAADLG